MSRPSEYLRKRRSVSLAGFVIDRSLQFGAGLEFTFPMHLRRGHRKEGRIRLGHGLGRSWGCWPNRNYRHGYCPNKVLFEVFCCCGVAAADMNDGALPDLLVEGVPTGCWTGGAAAGGGELMTVGCCCPPNPKMCLIALAIRLTSFLWHKDHIQ